MSKGYGCRHAAFGHTRLSIVDLTSRAHQPMQSADGTWTLVLNGEIYNFRTLARELRASGISLRTESDTEIVVEALAAWGMQQTLFRLEGMFSLAAYYSPTKEMFLVRDRVGIKPLYWMFQNDVLYFGSELRALRQTPGFTPSLNLQAVGHLLDYTYIPAPLTIFQGVNQIRPGTGVTIGSHRTPSLWRYASITGEQSARFPDANVTSMDEVCDHLQEILSETLEQYLSADVEVGCFLSGGVDSSLIAAIAQQVCDVPLKTFTIGFKEQSWDESADADRIAKYLRTDHHHQILTEQDICMLMDDLSETFDEPFADFSQVPTLALSRFARGEVKVCLSGDGGDEIFGGYERYAWAPDYWSMIASFPRPLRHWAQKLFPVLSSAGIMIGPDLWNSTRWRNALLVELQRHFRGGVVPNSFSDFYDGIRRTTVQPLHHIHYDIAIDGEVGQGGKCQLDYMQHTDVCHFLPDCNLTKIDRASMSVGLEFRTPLLAEKVINFALSLPAEMRVNEDGLRVVQKHLLQRYLPEPLFDRPKMGFGFPIDAWLRAGLREWAEELLSESSLKTIPFIDAKRVRSLWRAHLEGGVSNRHSLWPVLMLLGWQRRWLS